ncbi:MAG TPA: hypothetical protein VI072_05555 [Polyangiaceae bacterium]
MKRRSAALRAVARAAPLLPAVFAAGCLDTKPLDFEPVSADAGTDAPEDPICRECLSSDQGQCQAAYEQCRQDETCWTVINCALERSCMNPPSFEDRFTCANPCLQSAGLNTPNNPAIDTLLTLNICANDSCRSSCIKS